MALFGKRPQKPARTMLDDFEDGVDFEVQGNRADVVGLFTNFALNSPNSIGTLGHLIREYLEKYGNEFGVTAANPPARELYAEYVSEDRIVVRAGSKLNELWRVEITLTQHGAKTTGTARFVPNWGDEHIWITNVISIFSSFRFALESEGGHVDPTW